MYYFIYIEYLLLTKIKITRGTAGRRSPTLIHKWNNLTVRYAGLIPPRPHHLNSAKTYLEHNF